MKKKNARSLDAIAVAYNALERASIIDAGDLLIEAKGQCDHGKWLDWVERELDCSITTAERRMRVAELAAKFPKLRNLQLGKGTLYELVDQDEEDLPAIVAELAKRASKSRLATRDARRVIDIAIARSQHGDFPDATLCQLAQPWWPDDWSAKAIAALKELQPTTDEGADAIVDDIRRKHEAEVEAELEAEAEADADEAAAILDGPPPLVPPASPPQDHQPLPSVTPDPNVDAFAEAVQSLCWVSTRTTARKLADAVSLDDLGTAHDLIEAVLTAARARKTAPADA